MTQVSLGLPGDVQICVKSPEVLHHFFYYYLAPPWPILSHCRGDSFTNPMLITVYLFRPECHQKPRNKVGSKSPVDHLVWFELRTFRNLS